jgi:hypothetical protein
MTKLTYLLAAAAAITLATPTFAQDAPKAGATINQGAAPTGQVKRDDAKPQEGRGEMRKDGDRERGRMEVRGERRDGDRGEMRGERREMRSGVRVELGDRDRGERRYYRSHAERVVIVHRRHRHHHRHYHSM